MVKQQTTDALLPCLLRFFINCCLTCTILIMRIARPGARPCMQAADRASATLRCEGQQQPVVARRPLLPLQLHPRPAVLQQQLPLRLQQQLRWHECAGGQRKVGCSRNLQPLKPQLPCPLTRRCGKGLRQGLQRGAQVLALLVGGTATLLLSQLCSSRSQLAARLRASCGSAREAGPRPPASRCSRPPTAKTCRSWSGSTQRLVVSTGSGSHRNSTCPVQKQKSKSSGQHWC